MILTESSSPQFAASNSERWNRVFEEQQNLNRNLIFRLGLVACFCLAITSPLAADDNDLETQLATAWENYWRGRYAEAIDGFQATNVDAGTPPQQAQHALGIAASLWDTGKQDAAMQQLNVRITSLSKEGEVKESPQADSALASLHARRAQYQFIRGETDAVKNDIAAALEKNETNLEARWFDAEIARVTGDLDAALKGYEWFLDYHLRNPKFDSAEDVRWTCLAAAQFARWKRNSRQFHSIVNKFYPDAIKLNDHYWPARVESARIFLEKYNRPQAKLDLDRALRINPQSAETLAAYAEYALANYELEEAANFLERAKNINPKLLDAFLFEADYHFACFDPRGAREVLDNAKKIYPNEERLLGRLAAAHISADGNLADDSKSVAGEIIAFAVAKNKHCGEFYAAMGDSFDRLRRYPLAVKYYELATQRMPQLVDIRGKLGMVQLRLGDEASARKLLDESFDIDPFNVRVKNSLTVLSILEKYETITTDHFVIRHDPADTILAEQMADYLEEVAYPEVTQSLGYEPKQKSLIEIFRSSGRLSGHSLFSARMVGLPYVGTVAACAGRAVALASPNEVSGKYHWANVIKHEFVHVVNMEQTAFAIPHWYTEALAVSHEGHPRSESWNRVLMKRHASEELFDLSSINGGFIRPQSSDDWTLAYSQAELYADYMASRFGVDVHTKLLAAYAKQLPTPDAIETALGVTVADFEAGYKEYLETEIRGIKLGPPNKFGSVSELRQAAADNPNDAEVQAQLAATLMEIGGATRARQTTETALALDADHPLANAVMARIEIVSRESRTAEERLERTLNKDRLHPQHLALLAAIKMRSKDYAAAEELYLLGEATFPADPDWLKSLAKVYLLAGNEEAKLRSTLEKLAPMEESNSVVRKRLAKFSAAENDWKAAIHWGQEAMYIDANDPEIHGLLARAFAGERNYTKAARHYAHALLLNPNQPGWRFALADALVQAERTDEARRILEKLLEDLPDYPGADTLLESISERDKE
jgi:Tfp pilus assembly protein PilF